MLNEVDAPLPHMCRAVGDISDCGMVLWQIGYLLPLINILISSSENSENDRRK
eukprot:COSAG02_NODE_3707_length_6348_cov_36.717051_2_plen_53_part_00